jgi:hypothetical protein
MHRRFFIKGLSLWGLLRTPNLSFSPAENLSDRQYWVAMLQKLAEPVLTAVASNELRQRMPVEAAQPEERRKYTHLEAFARLLTGISPWLQLNKADNADENKLLARYLSLASAGLSNAVNPKAADYMNFGEGGQPLVDAAFLAHALIRCPRLWETADAATRANVVAAFRRTRNIKPYPSNWLLFSAMIETFFLKFGEEYDKMRLDYALRQHEQWYKGDGLYGDGAEFHYDYYNSFVIHPFLHEILSGLAPVDSSYETLARNHQKIAVRYSAIQERLIAPDGSFPVVGRSMAYRTGAFHHLAHMALHQQLPEGVTQAQVRSALTAMMKQVFKTPDNFDKNGWLRLGLSGHQPSLAEGYISTGSLYLCSTVLLPLGLPSTDAFWQAPYADWTARKVWKGVNIAADKALHL